MVSGEFGNLELFPGLAEVSETTAVAIRDAQSELGQIAWLNESLQGMRTAQPELVQFLDFDIEYGVERVPDLGVAASLTTGVTIFSALEAQAGIADPEGRRGRPGALLRVDKETLDTLIRSRNEAGVPYWQSAIVEVFKDEQPVLAYYLTESVRELKARLGFEPAVFAQKKSLLVFATLWSKAQADWFNRTYL